MLHCFKTKDNTGPEMSLTPIKIEWNVLDCRQEPNSGRRQRLAISTGKNFNKIHKSIPRYTSHTLYRSCSQLEITPLVLKPWKNNGGGGGGGVFPKYTKIRRDHVIQGLQRGSGILYIIIYTAFRHQFFENSEKLYIYRFFKIIYIVISVENFRNYYTFIYHFNDDLQFLFEQMAPQAKISFYNQCFH